MGFSMLHTKFRGNRSTGSGKEDCLRVFTIYGRGSHLGHVTSIKLINFHFLICMYLKVYISNLLNNDPVVSEKSIFPICK